MKHTSSYNVAQKLISTHLVEGEMDPGEPIALTVDQTLTQDATGTLVMLELEAMGLDRVATEVSAQYVDHNLIQQDHRNPDDHLFLLSACQRFGVWFSRPGNGVSHPVHQERFGRPGATLLGSDSHTPAGGALGMLAIGAGGLEVALAMAGEPFRLRMPAVWGVRLTGALQPWVSAKDVILELLRRHGVSGGRGKVLAYHGPGVDTLTAWDRHVIANMGTELGATTTVFPADDEVRRFLRQQGREDAFEPLLPDDGARYDIDEELDLGAVEPLIAMPSSPGNVRRVKEVAGEPIYQCYVGSSANPGYRDIAVVAETVKEREVAPGVSLDINPASRQILGNLVAQGHIANLITAGARLHQTGCNGCIGMGQAPATGQISLRTVPRNFPGRSGTREDRVCLVSPETAAASAVTGVITDPRDLDQAYPRLAEPEPYRLDSGGVVPPLEHQHARTVGLRKGPNIVSLPDLAPLPDTLTLPVLLKVGDDISTDEIMPAGTRVLPYRSNIPAISRFVFDVVDETYADRATEARDAGDGHAVLAGENYGQGSSREHAALAPRYLGLRAVLARSFARIHRQNLCNFGVLALEPVDPQRLDAVGQGDRLRLTGLRAALGEERPKDTVTVEVDSGQAFEARHGLSPYQVRVMLAGGLINHIAEQRIAEQREDPGRG